MNRNRLAIAGIAAGITFGIGFLTVLLVPGLGGTSTTKDFTDFYGSSGRRGTATVLGLVLLIGTWLMVWMLTELRARLGPSMRADLAYRFGVVGTASVLIGIAIELGPTMAQSTSDNARFVGIPIAHAFAQAGAGVVVVGLLTVAVALFLDGLELTRAATLPRWLGILSIVTAVLLLGSFFVAPGFLFPLWALIVGITASRRSTGPRREAARGFEGATERVAVGRDAARAGYAADTR